jgi:hypothetical protein
MNLQTILMSVPTSADGASAAATFRFVTSGYKRPHQGRSSSMDQVHNQNGVFRYIYDNGPNAWEWEPFSILLEDALAGVVGGAATQQKANLDYLWNWTGAIGLAAPEGTYVVGWDPSANYEPEFKRFPAEVGDKIVYEGRVTIQLIEGG